MTVCLEMQFGINHVAHFYLFQCLRDQLLAGAKDSPGFASRVVNISSSAYRASTVNSDDVDLEAEGKYSPIKAYGHSKTTSIVSMPFIDKSVLVLLRVLPRVHHYRLLTPLSGQPIRLYAYMALKAYMATGSCLEASRPGYRCIYRNS